MNTAKIKVLFPPFLGMLPQLDSSSRHDMVSMMVNQLRAMETVSKFLGHSSVKITENLYAKILDTMVVDDFGRLFGNAPAAPVLATPGAVLLPHARPARRLACEPSAKEVATRSRGPVWAQEVGAARLATMQQGGARE